MIIGPRQMRVKQSVANFSRNMEHIRDSLRFLGNPRRSLRQNNENGLARELLSCLKLHSGEIRRRVRRNALIGKMPYPNDGAAGGQMHHFRNRKIYRRPATGHQAVGQESPEPKAARVLFAVGLRWFLMIPIDLAEIFLRFRGSVEASFSIKGSLAIKSCCKLSALRVA
jgi:hypothetical protein